MAGTVLLFALVVFSASFLQTALGFGFPIVAMVFLPGLFGYTKAVALVQCIATVSTLYLTVKYFRRINWKVLLPILVPSVVIGCIVTLFSFSLSSVLLTLMLGVMLIFLSVYFLFFNRKAHVEPTLKSGLVMGFAAGIGNGLFSVGGPATALYLLSALDDKVEYLACIQTFFTVCNAGNMTIRLLKGSLQGADIGLLVIGWVVMLAGTFAGQKCFALFRGDTLKKVVYAFIGVNGIWMVLSAVPALKASGV